jgi:hypothetical protein
MRDAKSEMVHVFSFVYNIVNKIAENKNEVEICASTFPQPWSGSGGAVSAEVRRENYLQSLDRTRIGTTMKALLLLFALSASAQLPLPQIDFAPHTYVCLQAADLRLDGKLDDASWQAATWSENFVDIEGPRGLVPSLRTRVKMLWDESYFYFGAELEEPQIWACLTERDAVIFHDNDFEIFLDPDGDTHNYYELEVNAMGTEWDLKLDKPYRDGVDDSVAHNEWDIDGLITAICIDGTLNDASDVDKGWSLEIAIPWTCIEEGRPQVGEQWRVNFSRVQWDVDSEQVKIPDSTEHNWVWSPQGLIAMHYPEMWGFVQFEESASPFIWNHEQDLLWALRQKYYTYRQGGGASDGVEEIRRDDSVLASEGPFAISREGRTFRIATPVVSE